MFGGNKVEKEKADLANKKNQIEKGTKIIGDIQSHGNIRLDGDMVGNVHSESKVVLGQTCVMEGKLFAQNAEVSGNITGEITVSDLLILKSSAIVNADVVYGKIMIEDGAVLNGSVKQGTSVVNKTNEKSEAPKKQKSAR